MLKNLSSARHFTVSGYVNMLWITAIGCSSYNSKPFGYIHASTVCTESPDTEVLIIGVGSNLGTSEMAEWVKIFATQA